ncbi:hypothetical protein QJQ45_029910 [Haematococcus lacustris]|nr:hypothetical protein QJQ45_029910 [Haematococcus lacustris]
MDRFVVRGISANDAAENLQRQVDQHDEMLHRRALDREDAAAAKRGPGRPRKLSSIGLLLARDPAASPSTPPPPSRTGRSHANWWHPASIRPILQAVQQSTINKRTTICVEIKDRLLALRQGGVALNHTTARSVMLAVIQQREPHLLSSNGGALRLSAQFVRDFLENQLNWVTRSGYKNAGTLRAFDDSYQRAAMTEMGRLFEVPLLDPVLKVPQLLQVFEDEQNADAVEDDAAVEANDLEAALLARPAHKPLPGMIVPMEDCPLLTEQVAGIDVQSMTAVELMVAAQQWSAITRAMPTAKPSVKPAAATADGPTIRKRGRPLGSRNKPKPPAAQATPTPTRKQARLVCNTSSSANSSSANTSSASNSSGDNSSSEDGSANNEEWVVSKLAAGAGAGAGAGCKKSAVGVVGQARAATGVAGRTRSAAGVAGRTRSAAGVAGRTESAAGVSALAKAAAWVTARARKFECSEEDVEICRHCKQPQEHHDFMGEVQCPY